MPRIYCPKCTLPMESLDQEADLVVDRCSTCKGVWMDQSELQRISGSDLSQESYNTGPQSGKTCPKCKVKTREVVVPTKDKIILDICGQCHGIWFDQKELPQVVNFLRFERIKQKKAYLSGQ